MRARDVKRETYDAAAIPRSRRQVAADGEEAQESTSATQIVEAFLETPHAWQRLERCGAGR